MKLFIAAVLIGSGFGAAVAYSYAQFGSAAKGTCEYPGLPIVPRARLATNDVAAAPISWKSWPQLTDF